MERGGLSPPLSLSDLVAARGRGGLLSEAVATIHWAVLAGLEGYFGLLAALGTDGGVHLSRGAAVAAAAAAAGIAAAGIALVAARLTACWTALGLVSVAFLGVIGLIVGAEGKRLTAVLAGKTPILVAHR
jgi:hypothetical protein